MEEGQGANRLKLGVTVFRVWGKTHSLFVCLLPWPWGKLEVRLGGVFDR